jgi:hypothetical protein
MRIRVEQGVQGRETCTYLDRQHGCGEGLGVSSLAR